MKYNKLICLFLSALCLIACVPTPDEPIVIGKDQSEMIESASKPITGDDAALSLAERLGVPERYTYAYQKGTLTIDADAEIVVPDGELPIVRVALSTFTDEDAHRFAEALFGEDAYFIEPGSKTRAMWEKDLAPMREAIEHWDEWGYAVTMADTVEEYEQLYRAAAQEAAEASDTLPRAKAPFVWQTPIVSTDKGQGLSDTRYMHLLAMRDEATCSMLDLFAGSGGAPSRLSYYRDMDAPLCIPSTAENWPNELTVSEKEAKAAAEEQLFALGFTHLTAVYHKCVRSYESDAELAGNGYRAAHLFVFMPVVNNTAATFTAQELTETNAYSRPWQGERAYVLVDDTGVQTIEYLSPCVIGEYIVPAVTLLPFERIREIFEKMIVIVDNDADTYGYQDTVSITRIRLGMVSIPQQNGAGGLLIPAWDFIGSRERLIDEEARTLGAKADETYSYLTINAVDGSIIRRG